MIPSHLSALPCGSCRQPTSTLTLRRIDKKFLCPICHERTRLEVKAQKIEPAQIVAEEARKWLLRTKKAASLSFLAFFVTGFIVLPSLIDPTEAAAYTPKTAQLPAPHGDSSDHIVAG